MKKTLLALGAVALALPSVANAAATVTINTGTTFPATSNLNDFKANLTAAGLTGYTTTGASLTLSGAATITFWVLGSESGFSDTFSAPNGISYTENSAFQDNWGAPILLGTAAFGAGNITGLTFTTTGPGGPITIGMPGFGIFLPTTGGNSGLSTFYLGYDDQITNPDDDNHDDLIIKAVVGAPVPEPTTWAMMLLGFGVVGFAMRRRAQPGLGMVRA